jgi:hypothetical protein|tara:strand:+ start:883 stop:1203 length:321 start_codon:yes stop_codon:yes gene_type:complete
MNLIVRAPLSEPPTESLPFRYVLSCANIDCDMDVLLECENGTKDLYWKFLNQRGMFDFISDIILPLEERGLSIDTQVRNQRATILTNYIRIENQLEIIESVKNRLI